MPLERCCAFIFNLFVLFVCLHVDISSYFMDDGNKKTSDVLCFWKTHFWHLLYKLMFSSVQEILHSRSSITPTPQALADLQGLCAALLDTINDKNLALSHQRKTNKWDGIKNKEALHLDFSMLILIQWVILYSFDVMTKKHFTISKACYSFVVQWRSI